VSEHSDFPPEARTIPRVGGLDVSAEKVASLSPDLVLATREGNARGPVSVLENAGLSVVVLPTGSLDAVVEGIRVAGDALGRREEADRLAGELLSRRAAVRGHVTGRPRPKTILLVWPDPPQAAGGGTFLDDVLSEAGGENLLGNRPGWPVVSAEYLTTAPIEVFVFPASAATFASWTKYQSDSVREKVASALGSASTVPIWNESSVPLVVGLIPAESTTLEIAKSVSSSGTRTGTVADARTLSPSPVTASAAE
jgi:hypothetical protein